MKDIKNNCAYCSCAEFVKWCDDAFEYITKKGNDVVLMADFNDSRVMLTDKASGAIGEYKCENGETFNLYSCSAYALANMTGITTYIPVKENKIEDLKEGDVFITCENNKEYNKYVVFKKNYDEYAVYAMNLKTEEKRKYSLGDPVYVPVDAGKTYFERGHLHASVR